MIIHILSDKEKKEIQGIFEVIEIYKEEHREFMARMKQKYQIKNSHWLDKRDWCIYERPHNSGK